MSSILDAVERRAVARESGKEETRRSDFWHGMQHPFAQAAFSRPALTSKDLRHAVCPVDDVLEVCALVLDHFRWQAGGIKGPQDLVSHTFPRTGFSNGQADALCLSTPYSTLSLGEMGKWDPLDDEHLGFAIGDCAEIEESMIATLGAALMPTEKSLPSPARTTELTTDEG